MLLQQTFPRVIVLKNMEIFRQLEMELSAIGFQRFQWTKYLSTEQTNSKVILYVNVTHN